MDGAHQGDAKSRLAALLAKQPTRDRAATSDPFAASLVRLYTGGSKRPFYCVHPGSGAVGCFSEIAPLVDPARPFYALQAPGVDGRFEPIADLVALAQGYVAEIRRAQPHGPYLLGGWSLGGSIAMHVARELRAAGEPVAMVVLFDTQRVEALHAAQMSREEALELTHRQGGFGAVHLAQQRGVAIDVDVATERFRREQPRTTAARLDVMLRILVDHGVFTDANHPMFRVFRANMLALGDYGMPDEPYDGDVTLFRCRNDEFGEAFARIDEGYGWSKTTVRPISLVPMPSHHFALFHGEVMPLTARELRACLDRAEQQGDR